MEQTSNVVRSEDYKDILAVVRKLKLEKTDLDAYDHPSVAYELEQLFLKKLQQAHVIGRSELLLDFLQWYNEHHPENYIPNSRVGNYLQEKSSNSL